MTSRQRAYKFRFYPTDEQRVQLAQTFGCARLVYNKALDVRTQAWREYQKKVNYVDTSKMMTQWKKDPELSFLSEVSTVPLQQSLKNLQAGFDAFFRKQNQYPKFKSRKSKQSATYTYMAFRYEWEDDSEHPTLTLAKHREPLDIRWSRIPPRDSFPNRITVSKDSANRYFVSILIQEEIEQLPKVNQDIGIDLGLKTFAVTSTGSQYPGPKYTQKYEQKLAKAQRQLSRKEKGSKNREKARLKVAKIHAKISDSRRDFLHKLSTKLVRENQTITCETLAVKNMVKNRRLSKAVSDASWSEFLDMLAYKSEWYGRELVQLDQWYPSTQLCSSCGYRNQNLDLSDRTWTCPQCSVFHDRDINAAKNIKAAGLAVLAYGDGVRLQRGYTSEKHPSLK